MSAAQAAVVGRRTLLSPSVNACGICGGDLQDFSHLGGPAPTDPCVQLACKHNFHHFCMQGWTIVGK